MFWAVDAVQADSVTKIMTTRWPGVGQSVAGPPLHPPRTVSGPVGRPRQRAADPSSLKPATVAWTADGDHAITSTANCGCGGMADALDSGSSDRKVVEVRLLSSALDSIVTSSGHLARQPRLPRRLCSMPSGGGASSAHRHPLVARRAAHRRKPAFSGPERVKLPGHRRLNRGDVERCGHGPGG